MAQVFGVGIDELQKTLGNNRYFYGLRRTLDGTIYMVKADLLELEDGVELNRPGNINENYKAEINRLESILSLPSRDRFRYELAHVIQRNMGSWWQTIRINKGSKHGIKKGDAVILHPKVSGTGGTCLDCRRGNDMHAENPIFAGLNVKHGGYSELLQTSVRNLIKIPKVLGPIDVAPFSDAGLTAYRVVKKATRHLLPGENCVIIGAGGLGHIAIQCLRAMCAANIIVVEKAKTPLDHAMELGADHGVLIDGNEIEKVKELTKGKGAEAVIDFVGEKGSTAMGLSMTKATGTFYIVGYGEEIRILAIDMIDQEKSIVGSLVGTWAELYELMELADKGLVKLSMKEYKLEEANKALHDLNEGKIKGRAVLVP